MSSQSEQCSSHREEEKPCPSTVMAPTTFHSFCDLPRELQIMIWKWAFWTGASRRLACLRIHSTPSARLSQQVLNLDNRQARIGWPLTNPLYLRETDHAARLLATSFLSRTVGQGLSGTPWLQQLGLGEYHINPHTDIVFFGSERNLLTDNGLMMAASLVLGSAFTSIMVPAASFVRSLCLGPLQEGKVEPVSTALTILRAIDPVWDEIFRPGPNTLRPALPRNMYFFVGPLPSVDLCSHGPGCIHLEHLEVFNLYGAPDFEDFVPDFDDRTHFLHLLAFWSFMKFLPELRGEIPNIFIVRLSPQGGAE